MTKVRKIQQASNKDKEYLNTIFHITEEFLNERYRFRFNEVKNDIEITDINKEKWKTINENNLYLHLQKSGVKISINNLIAILKSDFVPTYNPLLHYFENLKKYNVDKDQDYIKKLCGYVKAKEPEQFEQQLRKWLVRTCRCAIDEHFYNKQAFVIVQPGQNTGKTTLCRWLCPPALEDYIAEDISDDKDSRIMLTKNFIINMDELSSLARKEINNLKALFSKDKINERLPYERRNSILSRSCSFIGSTNLSEFLTDETGSVRWLCFEIDGIDWGYTKAIDINDIWRQAYALHLKWTNELNLTIDEIKENEIRNSRYQLMTVEREMIFKYFKVPEEGDFAEFLTASEISDRIAAWSQQKRLNKMLIGRAMIANGFDRLKDSKSQRYGYNVKFIQPESYINETR